MKLWIITVNFGDTVATESLIDSVATLGHINSIKVGIADNASSDQSSYKLKKIIEKTKLDIKIFSYKKNFYYWPAAKKVINNLKNSIGSYPDWIVVCNNDIIFCDKLFLKKLVEIDQEKYPIIGPDIINYQGKKLNPFMIDPLSRLEKFYWSIYFMSYPLSIVLMSINKFLKTFIIRSKSNNISKTVLVDLLLSSFIESQYIQSFLISK